jgi:hypothetical protein
MKKEMNQRFKTIIYEKFRSQAHFAQAYGASTGYINDLTRGRTSIGQKVIKRLIDLIPDINIRWLKKGEGEKYIKELTIKDEIDTNYRKQVLELHKIIDNKEKIIELQQYKINTLLKELESK